MIIKIHEQGHEATECPCPLVQGKPDLENTQAITVASDAIGDIAEEPLVKRVWEGIAFQARLRQDATLDDADVLVDGAIPHHPKNVLHTFVPNIPEEPDITSQLEEMILHSSFKVFHSEMRLQSQRGLLGETEGPGNIGRPAPFQH